MAKKKARRLVLQVFLIIGILSLLAPKSTKPGNTLNSIEIRRREEKETSYSEARMNHSL